MEPLGGLQVSEHDKVCRVGANIGPGIRHYLIATQAAQHMGGPGPCARISRVRTGASGKDMSVP